MPFFSKMSHILCMAFTVGPEKWPNICLTCTSLASAWNQYPVFQFSNLVNFCGNNIPWFQAIYLILYFRIIFLVSHTGTQDSRHENYALGFRRRKLSKIAILWVQKHIEWLIWTNMPKLNIPKPKQITDNICGKFGKAKSVAIYGLDTEKTNVVMFMQSYIYVARKGKTSLNKM